MRQEIATGEYYFPIYLLSFRNDRHFFGDGLSFSSQIAFD